MILVIKTFNYLLQLRDAVGQRFSSGWSSAGSYKSSKSVKSNRSDKLVKKIIKRDKARNGAINKGYLTNGSQDNGRDQVNIHFHLFYLLNQFLISIIF